MTREKVKEIVEYLTSTFESENGCINFALDRTSLGLSYDAIYDCDDETVMHVDDHGSEYWVCYDKIEYISC